MHAYNVRMHNNYYYGTDVNPRSLPEDSDVIPSSLLEDSDMAYEDGQSTFSLLSAPKELSAELLQPGQSPVPTLDMMHTTASPGENPTFKPWMRPIEAYFLGMTEEKEKYGWYV
jgi:hypothetical protein